MNFSTTAISVLLLVAMALPGYILVKIKVIKPSGIPYFAAVLLYVCQPFLSWRSFLQVNYSLELLKNLGIVFLIALAGQGILFGLLWLIFYRWFDKPESTKKLFDDGFLEANITTQDPEILRQIKLTQRGRAYRVVVLTSTFANAGFFGVPVLQFLFPLHPETIAYSAVFLVAMNLMSWTVASYVLTGDKKFIKLKKALINPQTVVLIIALPMFFCGITIDALPAPFVKIINYMADMTAPLCMLILGMRFGVSKLKDMFIDWKVYFATFIKVVVFPLAIFLILMPFKMDSYLRATLVILSGMPSATINLNLAELYNADQKTTANVILLSTLFSIITIPLIMMLVEI